jgi:hypothetical protein
LANGFASSMYSRTIASERNCVFSVLIAESPRISFRIYIVSHNSDFTASSSCRKLSTELWP